MNIGSQLCQVLEHLYFPLLNVSLGFLFRHVCTSLIIVSIFQVGWSQDYGCPDIADWYYHLPTMAEIRQTEMFAGLGKCHGRTTHIAQLGYGS
jgi:hypothetical protein